MRDHRRSGRVRRWVRRTSPRKRSVKTSVRSPKRRRDAFRGVTTHYDTSRLPPHFLAHLREASLTPRPNAGGGDCLFHAVLDTGLQPLSGETVESLRRTIDAYRASQRRASPKLFRRTTPDIRHRGVWGTTEDLMLVAEAYDVNFLVASTAEEAWTVVGPFGHDAQFTGCVWNTGGGKVRGDTAPCQGTHWVALT